MIMFLLAIKQRKGANRNYFEKRCLLEKKDEIQSN